MNLGSHAMQTTIQTLLVLASERETQAVGEACRCEPPESPWNARPIGGGGWIIQTGVGKANAAAGVASCLSTRRVGRIINLGLAGALPGGGLELGQAVLASRSVFADEGIDTPEGFLSLDSMGFPMYEGDDGRGIEPDGRLAQALRPLVDAERGVATVSTCSGTDSLAMRIRRRTGSAAEAMEGAAVLLVARSFGVPAAEVRVVSNTTGDRADQQWAIGPALDRLGEVARSIVEIAGV
ncbi:MAG TPA: futalosine hydrolase [Phycisphaerales bacterium]|nr:futalosine hydrolase [Phycisphaerales bacterium]